MYKLPVYNIVINDNPENDEELHMTCISLVDDPAVEVDFLKFKDNKQSMKFEVNQDEQCITGVAIRADKPIYRYNEYTGEEYYVIFSKAVIKQLVDKYSKEGLFNSVSLQHSGENITGVTLRELYIKDVNKGINPVYFSEVEDGSLFVTYHVEDADLWQEIKASGMINGFSIEVVADMELAGSVEAIFNKQNSSIIDYLLSDKKKVEFSVSTDLTKAMENREVVNLTINGNSTIQDAQIYQLAKQDGQNVVILYGRSQQYPDSRQWYIYKASDITNVKPSNAQFIDWVNARRGAGYEAIQDMLDVESIETIRSAVAPRDEIDRAIDERRVCIINYRDASQENCTGARQVLVCERGVNRAGNAALRAYQYFGANHSESEGWKQFLLGRILSFEIVEFMTPVDIAPPGYNPAPVERDGFQSQKWSIFPN